MLKSFDIDSSFINNYSYIKAKNSIDRLELHYFKKSIDDGGVVFNTLKGIIRKSDVPNSFLYMAMIESRFLINAKSNKKASGLWQILPQTAKLLKLKINKSIDERLDPVKSTKAALKYLSYLHKRFHKWYLAAMAYNCGESRLSSAIKKLGSDDIELLMDPNSSYIPKETKRYILKLLNAALLSHLEPIKKIIYKNHKTKELKKITFNKNSSLKEIAKKFNVPYQTVIDYNQHIRYKNSILKKSSYCIYLPQNCQNITRYKKITYRIKPDDTLLKIAKKFHTSIKTLTKLNKNLTIILPVGKKIYLIDNRKLNHSLKLKFISKK